jgi:hypothetical protein
VILVIREEQLKAIEEARDLEYSREIISVMERHCPDLIVTFDKYTLEKIVLNSVIQGRFYGIKSRRATIAFVGLSIAAGARFISNRIIREFFEREMIMSSDVKVEWLFKRSLRILQIVHARRRLGKDL